MFVQWYVTDKLVKNVAQLHIISQYVVPPGTGTETITACLFTCKQPEVYQTKERKYSDKSVEIVTKEKTNWWHFSVFTRF